MKKILHENLQEFLAEGLEQDNVFKGEIDTNTGDFIWNEVMIWLMDQMKNAGPKFISRRFGSDSVHFDNPGRISIRCKKEVNSYGGGWNASFNINQDEIFKYKVISGKFTQKEAFKRVLETGQYKNYAISGAKIGDEWVNLRFKRFADLKLKKQCWAAQVKRGDYLKWDISVEYVQIDYEKDAPILSYKEVINLPKTIIKAFKASSLYRSFIKGESLEKLNKKLAGKAVKGELTIDNVVNFLESTPVKYVTISNNHSGPYATTGTDEGIDEFNISKLQAKFSEVNKFLLDNAEAIFKGLQKKKYSHSLGYYTFKQAGIKGNVFQIKRSCTTYYN